MQSRTSENWLPLRGKWLRMLGIGLAAGVLALCLPAINHHEPGYCMPTTISVWQLLHAGQDPGARDSELSFALLKDDFRTVESLVANGAAGDLPTQRQVLLAASWSGAAHTIKSVVSRYPHLRTDGVLTECLLRAATFNRPAVIRQLQALGVPLDSTGGNYDATALCYASATGCAEAVETLLELGADPAVADRRGKTAVDYATSAGQQEIVRLLKAHRR